jgi:hypothetical protein
MSGVGSIGGVNAAFVADTKSFDASVSSVGRQLAEAGTQAEQAAQKVAAAGQSIDRTAALQERAAERARRAWQREKVEQGQAIDADREAARAKELLALRLDIEARSAEHAATAQKVYSEAVEASVPHMAAASGALRLLEGGTRGNIRAAERFVSTTLGLAPILEAAFPVVGATALAGALYEGGKAAVKFLDNAVNLRDGLKDLAATEVEATKRAKEWNDEADRNVENILRLQHGEPAALQYRMSVEGQKPIDNSAYFRDKKIQDLPSNVKDKYQELYETIAPEDLPDRLRKIRTEVQQLQDRVDTPTMFGVNVNKIGGYGPNAHQDPDQYFKARLELAKQIQEQLEAADKARSSGLVNTGAQLTDAEKREAEQRLQKQQEAARKLAEAQRKAASEQLKALEDGLVADQAVHGKSAVEEYNYWGRKIATVHALGDNYMAMQKRYVDAFTTMSEEEQRRVKAAGDRENEIVRSADEQFAKELASKRKFIEQWLKLEVDTEKGNRQAATSRYEDVQESTAVSVETGAMSPAERNNALKAGLEAEVRAKMDSLDAELAAQKAAAVEFKALYGEDAQEYKDALAEELEHREQILDEQKKLVADASKQMATLQREAISEGWEGAINDMRRSASDVDGQIKSMFEGTVSTVNDSLLRMMTEDRSHRRGLWEDTGKQVFSGVAKTGLQFAEGSLLKAGPLAKLGTQSNPVYTRPADPLPAFTGASGVTSQLSGGSAGGLGSMLASALPFAGFLADGGNFAPGTYMVGERGPEIMSVGSSGFMHNNDSLRSALSRDGSGGSGDTHHHWNIDARGATNPGAVKQAAREAVMEAAPHIMAATAVGLQNRKRSRPSMASSG